jgi:hypothetical protein
VIGKNFIKKLCQVTGGDKEFEQSDWRGEK